MSATMYVCPRCDEVHDLKKTTISSEHIARGDCPSCCEEAVEVN